MLDVRRRQFIVLLGGAAIVWPIADGRGGALRPVFPRCQSRFRRSFSILQPLTLLSLPTLCNSILLVFDNSRQCSDVMVASGSAATLSEYELWCLQRASHSSKPKKAALNIVRMT